jgi:uncharacterized repeat protein (TIGR01451 family)
VEPRARLIVGTVLALLVWPAAASATINVTTNQDHGPGSLRQAIADASPGETINVPAETITLTTGELVINKNLVIAGAGAGSTILSAGHTARAILVMGSSTLDLSGFTVRDGLEQGAGITIQGGAFASGTGAVTIRHSIFTANTVDTSGGPGGSGGTSQGGAIYAGGALTLDDTQVTGNVASANGGSGGSGGIANGAGIQVTGALTITNSQVIGNVASANGGDGGFGGIADGAGIHGGTAVNATSVRVDGNTASADAGSGKSGGIADAAGLLSDVSTTISDSDISGNTTTARGGGGPSNSSQDGGIADEAGMELRGSLTLTRSTVSRNSADASGGPGGDGGIADSAGLNYSGSGSTDVSIGNMTIAGNSAVSSSGGIVSAGGMVLSHSGTGNVLLSFDTIADNSAVPTILTPGGGNIRASTSGGGAVKVQDSIISGGVGFAGAENCVNSPTFTSLGHNIENLNQCGLNSPTDKVNTNPGLGPLQDNGGPGQTLSFGLDSPAFDTADPTTCPATDERGVRRPQAAGCDIGALELELADLGLRNSARGSTLRLGQTVIFDLSASNGGSGTGHGTTITDKLPAGLTLVAAAPSSGSCTGTTTVSCNLGEFFPGQAGGVTLVARATKSGTQTTNASIGSSTTDPSAGNNSASASVKVARLALSSVSAIPKTFRLGRLLPKLSKAKVGTTIRFSLPEAATVKLVFARPKAGRKSGRRCVKPSPRNARGKRCTRFVAAGLLRVRAHAGGNKVRFQGRLSRRKRLTPGRYRLTLTAKDSFGNSSKPVAIRIRALAP